MAPGCARPSPKDLGTPMSKWTSEAMPSQLGRSALVTGTGGLGFETSLALARAGARVVIAGRNPDKGAAAVKAVQAKVPDARVRFGQVDLANLASIAAFASRMEDEQDSLDILVNNAGVMTPPQRRETSDGFELQMGTNYLSHFALTARLMPLLRKGKKPRVVTVGSVAARGGAIHFEDLHFTRNYHPFTAYGQSKLACIMFAFELSRRSAAAGWGVESLAAHPGLTRTDLIANGPGRTSLQGRLRFGLWFLFQPVWQGALPSLYAATDSAARNGGHYAPHALAGTRGYPREEPPPPQAQDRASAARLWEVSESLTRVSFA